MATTYSYLSTWSRCASLTIALRTFAHAVVVTVSGFIGYVASRVVDWALSVIGKPSHLALAKRLTLVGLNARETFHLRAAKRGRPVVMARWRMCASA